MTAVDLYERDQRVIAPNEQLRFAPVAIERAHGATLVAPDGRTLIDLSAGGSAVGIGYAHPNVVSAVTEAVQAMPGVSVLMATHSYAVDLAEKLLELTPTEGDDRCVYLGLAGSDANSAVVRGIREASSKPRILAFEHSYHGGIGLAQGISGVWNGSGVEMDPALVLVEFGDISQVEAELQVGDVAAVFVEPILSDGGLRIPQDGFLKELRELTTKYESLLVVDEVKVGLARTGRLFAYEYDNIRPDIVTMGKSLGGGLPISAAVGPRSILGARPAISLLTLAGNPVACAAALAVLRTIEELNLTEQSQRSGEVLAACLEQLLTNHPLVFSVRSRGMVGGFELRTSEGLPATSMTAKLIYRAWQLGVVFICVGPDSNVIELTPPLVITEQELRQAFATIDKALRDVQAGLVSDEDVEAYTGW